MVSPRPRHSRLDPLPRQHSPSELTGQAATLVLILSTRFSGFESAVPPVHGPPGRRCAVVTVRLARLTPGDGTRCDTVEQSKCELRVGQEPNGLMPKEYGIALKTILSGVPLTPRLDCTLRKVGSWIGRLPPLTLASEEHSMMLHRCAPERQAGSYQRSASRHRLVSRLGCYACVVVRTDDSDFLV